MAMKLVFHMQVFEGKQLIKELDTPPIEFTTPEDAARAVLKVLSHATRVNYAADCGEGPQLPMPVLEQGYGPNTTVVISEVRQMS